MAEHASRGAAHPADGHGRRPRNDRNRANNLVPTGTLTAVPRRAVHTQPTSP